MFRRRVVAAIAALSTLLIAVSATSAQAAVFARAHSDFVADPGFSRIGSTWYLTGTGTNGAGIMPVYQRTSPVGGYTKIGRIDADVSGYNRYWAPHIVKRGDWYFAFFSAGYGTGKPCLYYASSKYPARGYSDLRRLRCGSANGREAIDATTYVTTEGNTYLVWRDGIHRLGFPRGDYDIRARMLSFNTTAGTVGFRSDLPEKNLISRTGTTVFEAPSVVRYGGKVWLFVSRDRYDTNAYYTDVYSADSLHGTFTWRKTLMKTGMGYGAGPGGAEVEKAPDGSTYIAWHVWDRNKVNPSDPGNRFTRVSKLNWVNGLPVVAK